tara:strand:- start:5474 stop:7177 length:1704 start_codon:yes stop_codon:yes gene_type:complete
MGARLRDYRFLASLILYFLSVSAVLAAAFTDTIFFNVPYYLHDLWVVFDGAYRVNVGQVPNVDFYSPLGPAFYWLFQPAYLLSHSYAVILNLSNVLVALIATAGIVLSLRRRVDHLTLSLLIFMVISIALSGRTIEGVYGIIKTDFLAPYNRWCWALVVPIFGFFAFPNNRLNVPAAIYCGLLGAVIFYIKIHYFLVLLIFFIFGLIFISDARKNLLVFFSSMIFALIGIGILTGTLFPYIDTLATAAAVNQGDLRIDKFLYHMHYEGRLYFACLIFVWIFDPAARDYKDVFQYFRYRWRLCLLLLTITMGGIGILLQNHPFFEAFLVFLIFPVAYEWLRYYYRDIPACDASGAKCRIYCEKSSNLFSLCQKGMGIPVLIMCVPLFLLDYSTVMMQYRINLSGLAQHEGLAGTPYAGIRINTDASLYFPADIENMEDIEAVDECMFLPVLGKTSCQYDALIEGKELVQKYLPEGKAVLNLDFSNPFPSLTNTLPPRGAAIWWDYGRSYDAEHKPFMSVMLADTGLILLNKYSHHSHTLWRQYKDEILDAGFVMIDETQQHIAYRRSE